MKKVFVVIVIFSLLGCEPTVDISDSYEFDGRGGIKCRVDGEMIKPSPTLMHTNQELSMDWDGTEKYVFIYFTNRTDDDYPHRTVAFKFYADYNTDLTGNTYILTSNTGNFGQYSRDVYPFETTNEITGEVKILYHDVENHNLGGTFWFDAINSQGETITISDGEFDMSL